MVFIVDDELIDAVELCKTDDEDDDAVAAADDDVLASSLLIGIPASS